MKLTLLLATSCHSVLSSSTTSLHQKNVVVDKKDIDDDAVGSLISQYHEINGFHLMDRQQDVDVASNVKFHPLKQERQMGSEIPTFSPTGVPTPGDGDDGADTQPEDVVMDGASNIPTFTPTVYEMDTSVPVDEQTFAPTLVSAEQSYAPTLASTPTVGVSMTLLPTTEDYISITEVETEDTNDDEPHTPNWYPYTSLTSDQFNECQSNLIASDTNQDSKLSMSEYLNFLSLYSQSTNSKTVSPNTMNDVPYEFSLIFHTTSCQCAYLGEGEGCCIGDKEGVRIFASNTSGQTTGGGSSTTIDVGGGENDDVDTGGAIITTDDTTTGGQTTGGGSSTTIDVGGGENNDVDTGGAIMDAIAVIEDSYWDELPPDIQYAYTVLGYDQTSWDNDIPVPADEMAWDELSSAMKGAALSIGYTQEIWDESRRRKMKRFKNAMQLFGDDLRIVGGTNVEEDSGIEAMLDEETYTKNFCTDVYNAYKVTKSPTYAPSTETPKTESPTEATEPTSPSPTTAGSTSLPPVSTSPVTIIGSESPTYYPTMGGSNPPMETPLTPAPSVTTISSTSTPTSGLTMTKTPSMTDVNLLPIFLSYGISSNCGITAIDVLEANENTIMEGLTAATEVLVVDILNSTFPRDDGSITMRKKIFHQTYAEMYAGGVQLKLTNHFIDNEFKMVKEHNHPVYLEMAQPNDWSDGDRKLAYLEEASQNHRNLVYWTPMYPVEITDVEDVLNQACPAGVNCMKVYSTVNVVLEDGDSAQEIEDAVKDGIQTAFSDGTFFQNIPPQTLFCPGETAPPFTNTNPPAPETSAPVSSAPVSSAPVSSPDTSAPTTSSTVVETESVTSPPTPSTDTGVASGAPTIADTESVTSPPTPSTDTGVASGAPTIAETEPVTSPPTPSNADASSAPSDKLESNAPTTGSMESTTDAPITSPTEFETSPPTPTVAVTTKPTAASTNGATTSSPAQGETATTSPAAGETITASPSIEDTTGSASPVAGEGGTSSTSSPTSGATNMPPWALPDKTDSPTSSGTATASPVSSSTTAPLGNLVVEVTYDIANDCGLDSQAIMNEVNNTLKSGLIAATTTATISILNETYPRVDGDSRRQLQYNTQYLRHGGARTLVRLNSLDRLSQLTNHRHLVYYTNELPVTIDNVIDVTDGCPVGNNCLLIQSSITTVLEDGDAPDEVKSTLEDGIRESFSTGTFYQAIPEDTVICP